MGFNFFSIFIWKRDLKGAKIRKFSVFERYVEFILFIKFWFVVFFFEFIVWKFLLVQNVCRQISSISPLTKYTWLKGAKKCQFPKFERFYLSSSFDAIFFCKMSTFWILDGPLNSLNYFISKNSPFSQIFRIFIFHPILMCLYFFELIVLRAVGRMSGDFLYLLLFLR